MVPLFSRTRAELSLTWSCSATSSAGLAMAADNATLAALNCSRWKLWDLCRNDPEFPKPRDIAGKNSWFAEEIVAYKKSRPCRIYAAVVAVLAVVSVAAPFFAKILA